MKTPIGPKACTILCNITSLRPWINKKGYKNQNNHGWCFFLDAVSEIWKISGPLPESPSSCICCCSEAWTGHLAYSSDVFLNLANDVTCLGRSGWDRREQFQAWEISSLHIRLVRSLLYDICIAFCSPGLSACAITSPFFSFRETSGGGQDDISYRRSFGPFLTSVSNIRDSHNTRHLRWYLTWNCKKSVWNILNLRRQQKQDTVINLMNVPRVTSRPFLSLVSFTNCNVTL